MKLRLLSIKNLGCYELIENIPFHKLTVFIGENDAGKTTIAKALQILLTNYNPLKTDFFSRTGPCTDNMEISGVFELDSDSPLEHLSVMQDSRRLIYLTKAFDPVSLKAITSVRKEIYTDDRFNKLDSLKVQELKDLLQSLGLSSSGTKPLLLESIANHMSSTTIPKIVGDYTISFSDIEHFLPEFKRVSSSDYKDPNSIIQTTVQGSIQRKIRSVNDSTHPLYQKLEDVKLWIEKEIEKEAEAIPDFARSSLPGILSFKLHSNVDFSRSINISGISLDKGNGHQNLSTFGEGTRKKLWMSLLEWEQSKQSESTTSRSVIRVFDEPDLNLDYAAEKRLFDHIAASTKSDNLNLQNILCTHSVTLIDRSPVESINLIRVHDNDKRTIEFLRSESDDVENDIKDFFSSISGQLNITNTALFYERAFLIFEGETEAELLPILYQKLFNRTIVEDGIVLVNMYTCSAWRPTLDFLGNNRAENTIMVLDKDCTFPDSSARITSESLEGYAMDNNIFFVGSKELEDSFSNTVIARSLQRAFPREDGYDWQEVHIENIRQSLDEKPKFSEDLKNFVRHSCIKRLRSEVVKTSIGKAIALECRVDEIPEEIFNALRAIKSKVSSL